MKPTAPTSQGHGLCEPLSLSGTSANDGGTSGSRAATEESVALGAGWVGATVDDPVWLPAPSPGDPPAPWGVVAPGAAAGPDACPGGGGAVVVAVFVGVVADEVGVGDGGGGGGGGAFRSKTP